MLSLQAAERETYEEMHCVSAYTEFSPGERFLPVFLDMVDHHRLWEEVELFPETILDAGCSSGKSALALDDIRGEHIFRPFMMDLTDSGLVDEARRRAKLATRENGGIPFAEGCLWELMGRTFDWVYCCDVLEHIPPEFTMLVISRLLEAATKGVFLSIALQADNFGAWVGKPLHQTVQSYQWWHDRLSELGEIVEARDLLTNGLYLVRAKKP